jgi:seryl-tRNA synthetase
MQLFVSFAISIGLFETQEFYTKLRPTLFKLEEEITAHVEKINQLVEASREKFGSSASHNNLERKRKKNTSKEEKQKKKKKEDSVVINLVEEIGAEQEDMEAVECTDY